MESGRGVGIGGVRGGGDGGSDDPSFGGIILYISYIKCQDRDQCKNNPFKN